MSAGQIREIIRSDKGTIVRLSGEIDLNQSPELHEALVELCDESPPRIVVNLSDVQYMDSSGIGTLVEIFQRMRREGAKLIIVEPSERVRSVLEITKLDQFLPMADSEEAGLAS